MFRIFFSNQFRSLGPKAASMMLVFFALASYVMGFVRDLVIAYYFGAESVTDAYYSAFMIPDAIYTITAAGVLGGVFMPMLSKIKKESHQSYLDYLSAFLFFNTLFTGVLAVLAYFGMPFFMDLMLAKADASVRIQAVELSRLLLWSPILFSVANTLSSFLMSNKHYFSYSLGPVLYNVGIILSLLLFADSLGIVSAIYGVIFGLLMMVFVRLWDFRTLNLSLRFRPWHTAIPESLKLALYKILSILSVQVSLMVFNFVAYGLQQGSLSAFSYAKNLQSFAISLFGIAISQAVFPYLIDHKVDENMYEMNEMIRKTFLKILYFVWPSCVGMYLISGDLVPFLFERGEFDSAASAMTSAVLMVLALSIPFEAINHLFSRVYYAFLDTLRPVLISLLFLSSNVIMALFLAPKIGVSGFGYGYLLGSFMQMIALLYFFKSFGLARRFVFGADSLRILSSGFVMGICVFAVSGMGLVMQLFVGVLVYWGVSIYLNVFQFSDLNDSFKKIVGKVSRSVLK